MKCQKCGQNEVNFYYSSNVNGAVAETHLCSECAQSAGYDMGNMFDAEMLGFGNMLEGLLPLIAGGMLSSRLMSRPDFQEGLSFGRVATLPSGMPVADGAKCGCSSSGVANPDTKADDEMTVRRKLNMEMRAAAQREDFEKAAELRDKIRDLDAEQGR